MKNEFGISYAWMFFLWVSTIVGVSTIVQLTRWEALSYLFAVLVPAGGIGPFIVQIKTKRRLTCFWRLGKHHDDDPVVYKIYLMANSLLITWLLVFGVGVVQQVTST